MSSRFHKTFAAGPGRVVLARATRHWVSVSWAAYLSRHSADHGASGSGKTFYRLGTLMQAARDRVPSIAIDNKGELAHLFLTVGLPALAATDPTIASRVRVVDPFGRDALPLLRLTAPQAGIEPAVHAMVLADTLEAALDDTMGTRAHAIFLHLAQLCVERGEPLTRLLDWLDNTAALARAASKSADPALRIYCSDIEERESKLSLDSLAAKLRRFFFLPDTRRVLSAPSCLSFHDSFQQGAITVVNLGRPPAGAERLQKFFQAVLWQMLAASIMTRDAQPDDSNPHVLVIAEEFQAGLTRRHAETHLSALIAQARYRKVGIIFSTQDTAKVAAVDPTLVRLLRSCTGYESIFRTSLDDAKYLAPALAGTDRDLCRRITSAMLRLPQRHHFFWPKERFTARLVRAPLLDLAALKARAATAPPDVYDAIQQGCVALPRSAFPDPQAPKPYLECDS